MKNKKNIWNKVDIWKLLAVLCIIVFLLLILSLFLREKNEERREKEEKIPFTAEQQQDVVKFLEKNYISNNTNYTIKVDKEVKLITFNNTVKKIAKVSFLSDYKTIEFTVDIETYSVVQMTQIDYKGWMIEKKKEEKKLKDMKPKKWLHDEAFEKLFEND